MILVDLNQVLISNLMAQIRGKADVKPNKEMIRHMVLNSLRGFNVKFREEFGDLVLCSDAGDPWRREFFPNYKYSRKQARQDGPFDWDEIFTIITEIKNEVKDNFPYKVVQLDKVEADDIIAVICKKHHDNKVLIISGDKDFQQLQKYPNIHQYSPTKKEFVKTDSPQEYVYEHILKGDTSDGIPNFLSPDDTFVNRIKQKPVSKKKLAGWIDSLMRGNDPQDFCNEYHYRNFQRNQRLIDFDYIPDDIETDIYKEYEKATVSDRSKILPYMIKNDLRELIGKIEEF